ncbi:helix-turn-helix transcriptional regulator [Candidatus Gracilibacteria bacterium]|nr:helix-turn-helix transcriptional regulator [Candidatus Gracilibacteria bacterium]
MNNIIYRGVDITWLLTYLKGNIKGYSNFVNNINFAKDYGEITCEFEIKKDLNLTEENIKDRLEDVTKYDEILDKSKKDGISWNIGDGIFHYRINLNCLKLKNIIYNSLYKKNLANYFLFNRKYRCLSQEKLASMLGTKKANISKYEHSKNIPEIRRLIEILAPIKVPQIIDFEGKRLSFGFIF